MMMLPVRPHRNRQSAPGNTLVEYGIIGATVLVAAMGVLFVVGQQMNFKMEWLTTDMSNRAEQARQHEQDAQSTLQAIQAARQLMASDQNSYGTNTTTKKQSSSMSWQTAFTSGANGMDWFSYYDGVTNYTESPPDDAPVLSESEKELVLVLSNYGHKLAVLQQSLLDLARYCNGDLNKLQTSTLIVDGKPMNANEFISSVLEGRDLKAFQARVDAVLASPDASPEVKEMIQTLASKVTSDTNTLKDQIDGIFTGDVDTGQTHKDSANVCNAGGYSDTGTECTNQQKGG